MCSVTTSKRATASKISLETGHGTIYNLKLVKSHKLSASIGQLEPILVPSRAKMLVGHMHVVYYDKNEMGTATTPKP